MRAIGVGQVIETLKSQSDFHQRLPGFGLAKALAETIMAELNAGIAGEALREAHRAGIDIGNSAAVYTRLQAGNPVLEIEMLDLADMADQAADQS